MKSTPSNRAQRNRCDSAAVPLNRCNSAAVQPDRCDSAAVLTNRCNSAAVSYNRCDSAAVTQNVDRCDSAAVTQDAEDPLAVLAFIATDVVAEKFDSGASRCMTGDANRHTNKRPVGTVRITGFNAKGSSPTHIGLNKDGKEEYYVSDMPQHLTLLCANAYCQDGCAVLFANDGVVLRMTEDELAVLKTFLKSYPVQKHLLVNNRTYEVDPAPLGTQAPFVVEEAQAVTIEEAFNGTATRFFNTKINVSNQEERILTLLMTGLTYRDWLQHVKHGSIRGIPRDLTLHGMHSFSHKYGTSTDISQLASPQNVRDATGLREVPAELTRPGEMLVVDCMQSDYNLRDVKKKTTDSEVDTVREATTKLPTHGGAKHAAVCVDKYSSFVMVTLLKSVHQPEVFVRGFFEEYR